MSRQGSLVTAEWVAENLNNPQVVIVEVDEDTALYEQGHIESAITFHWRDDLQDGLIRDLISKEKFEALLSKSGISNDSTVILYGGNNNWFASYAFWYFKIYGHQDVRLLDGGRKRWELDGRAFVAAVPTRTATRYVAKERDNSIRAFRDEVIAAIGKLNIVDVRSPAEFSGELAAPAHLPQEQGQVKGHIPTAKNIPWSKAANEDGTFKSDAELKELYISAGVDLAKETIAYCRIGERSAFSWFVLHELLGVSNVKNYDGSWTEYGSLVGAPVALGA
ncbi:MAG: sulfurtransferase [Candidatus Planktophila sp.]